MNNNRPGVLHPKSSMSVLLVVSFLVCVHMSVSNIRHAVNTLPNTITYDESYATPMDKIVNDKRPHKSSSSKKASVSFGKSNNPSNGEKTNAKNVNKVHVLVSKMILSEIGSLEDSSTNDSASIKSYNSTSSSSNFDKSDGTKYKEKLDEAAISGDIHKFNLQSPVLSVIPNSNNTVISLISMGRLVDTFLVERCIRSIRRRGLFTGIIMVFTDRVGYKRYQETIPFWDDRTIIINGREEDMNPREENNEEPGRNQTEPKLKKFRQDTMVFKRFKTHHFKYIAEYPDLLDSIRYVMYVDVDNIIGNRLDTFFEDYTRMVTVEHHRATAFHRNGTSTTRDDVGKSAAKSNTRDHGDFGFISMFRDKHLRSRMHSGIIIYDLAFEELCVDGWRNEMDTFWDMSDQTMFLRVLKDYNRYRCAVFDLPPKFMVFANRGLMTDAMNERQKMRRKREKLEFPTFVHVTNYRVKRLNNATIHNEFVRHVLELKDNEMMTDTISWEDVVSPMARIGE